MSRKFEAEWQEPSLDESMQARSFAPRIPPEVRRQIAEIVELSLVADLGEGCLLRPPAFLVPPDDERRLDHPFDNAVIADWFAERIIHKARTAYDFRLEDWRTSWRTPRGHRVVLWDFNNVLNSYWRSSVLELEDHIADRIRAIHLDATIFQSAGFLWVIMPALPSDLP